MHTLPALPPQECILYLRFLLRRTKLVYLHLRFNVIRPLADPPDPSTLIQAGRPWDAEKYFFRALVIREAELGPDAVRLAITLYELGRCLREGEHDKISSSLTLVLHNTKIYMHMQRWFRQFGLSQRHMSLFSLLQMFDAPPVAGLDTNALRPQVS